MMDPYATLALLTTAILAFYRAETAALYAFDAAECAAGIVAAECAADDIRSMSADLSEWFYRGGFVPIGLSVPLGCCPSAVIHRGHDGYPWSCD